MTQSLIFEAVAPVTVAIEGSEQRYPVGRIFCVGRNYHAHAIEMCSVVDKSTMIPFYFNKHPQHLVVSGTTIDYPPRTRDFHYEMELVIAIGKAGTSIAVEQAMDYIYGYACGLDMTRRDLQADLKAGQRPWDVAKDFEGAAVLSPIVPKAQAGQVDQAQIQLWVNDEPRQNSTTDLMIWSIPEIVTDLSTYYHLQPGDLIYTGTPEGVGPVVSGDVIRGAISGLGEIELTIR